MIKVKNECQININIIIKVQGKTKHIGSKMMKNKPVIKKWLKRVSCMVVEMVIEVKSYIGFKNLITKYKLIKFRI